MNKLLLLWNGLERGARWRLAAGTVLILAMTVWFSIRTLRVDYDVLFNQLAESDAATLVERLKQLKIPYRLADEGATIEVPASQVHEVRLRLMSGGGLPLSGSVGFEIFDKQGLGATEQSQRVSYQRALQGELARTISTLNDVKQARVHLVLPESSLFKRDRQEARAAVTLSMKSGATLNHEQILGVQRLVAASVAGLEPARVVITDQRGITLSGPDGLGSGGVQTEARLTMKREIEDYVTRKVARLLDSTYGPGQAIVSADIALNFDEIHRTVQELEPSAVRRRRQVFSGNPIAGAAADSEANEPAVETGARSANGRSSTDVEYEYGRRVEQVVAAPGGITRISVGVIVPGDITAEKQQRIRDLVRMAAGVNEQRGDAIVIQALDEIGGRVAPAAKVDAALVEAEPEVPSRAQAGTPLTSWQSWSLSKSTLAWPALVLVAAAFIVLVAMSRRLGSRTRALPASRPLSSEDRELLLLEIEKALSEEGTFTPAGHKP